MGQKFSDLKGFFGVMENRECPIPAHVGNMVPNNCDNAETRLNVFGTLDIEENSPPRPAGGDIGFENNGNAVEGADVHFENIYSNGAETCRAEEENGNCVEGEVKLDQCRDSPRVSVTHRRVEEQGGASVLRRGTVRTLSFVSSKRARAKSLRSPKELTGCGSKKRNHWVLKFNCARLKGGSGCAGAGGETDIPEPNVVCDTCVCTGYRRTEEHHLGAGVVFEATPQARLESGDLGASDEDPAATNHQIDMSRFNPEDYPIEDCDERARQERAREIAEGVEPPPGFCPGQHIQLVCPPELTIDNLTALFQTHLGIHSAALTALSQLDVSVSPAVHTQVDYIHCLVPDLLQITACSFYWGKMDRYEAERLLDGRPEGTFLLRDSAQEEYLFSVSFRKYGRSLHARIEQWNHHFSFDSHDPGVFASPTVCGLMEHYKDPSCCMFFEPMLTIPLHRNFPFPLQHLCRAVVSSKVSYDGMNQLLLPKALKGYLKEYHYKQRVRVRRFDLDH